MTDTTKADPKPEDNGWTRRFIACEPRLSEAVELYKKSGFEVLLKELHSKTAADNCLNNPEEKECIVCFDTAREKYSIIFTRPENKP